MGEPHVNVKDLIEFLEEDVKGHKDAQRYIKNLVRRMTNSETFKK